LKRTGNDQNGRTRPNGGNDMKRTILNASAALGIAGLMAIAASSPADAQQYPDKPISVVVAYGPGGATDFQARIATMVAGNEDILGQPIVIVNRPGAGGQVGWNWMVESGSKDGYTLTAYNLPHMIAQSIVFDTQYNTDNIKPLANWGADPAVLIVGSDSEFETVDDLVQWAKDNPGQLTVSGAGLYVGHHVASLQLEKAAEVDLNFIPAQRGGVEAMQLVMGGQVQAGFNNLADAFRNQDRLRILAVADLERNEFIPDVPTFKELGYDIDDSSVNFRGIAAVEGVPDDVQDLLAERLPVMFEHDQVKKRMKEAGAPLRIMDREAVEKMFQERETALKELLADLEK
jgi:tripartite-type tricarboxylate transporter receptor subunit TctC